MLNVDKWKPQVITDSKVCPFLIIDNWFSENEFNNVFKEVDFLFSGRVLIVTMKSVTQRPTVLPGGTLSQSHKRSTRGSGSSGRVGKTTIMGR